MNRRTFIGTLTALIGLRPKAVEVVDIRTIPWPSREQLRQHYFEKAMKHGLRYGMTQQNFQRVIKQHNEKET